MITSINWGLCGVLGMLVLGNNVKVYIEYT